MVCIDISFIYSCALKKNSDTELKRWCIDFLLIKMSWEICCILLSLHPSGLKKEKNILKNIVSYSFFDISRKWEKAE